uniref:Uncharacterized protein n=1 Tax=Cacopsylla melanoneura TaxID=428564 RepID=A0A8D8ZCX4_9HEMI
MLKYCMPSIILILFGSISSRGMSFVTLTAFDSVWIVSLFVVCCPLFSRVSSSLVSLFPFVVKLLFIPPSSTSLLLVLFVPLTLLAFTGLSLIPSLLLLDLVLLSSSPGILASF